LTRKQEKKELIISKIEEYIELTAHRVEKKQILKAKNIYEFVSRTIEVSYATIARYMNELDIEKKEVFIPLKFEPGEVMQVDWCHVVVDINTERHNLPLFCAVLPYSYRIFAMICHNMKFDNYINAHIEAFKYNCGISSIIFYDNLKTSVFEGAGAKAIMNKNFAIFAGYYLFESRFMNDNKGNEKGAVENLCGHVRQIALTPIPKANSLKEIQDLIILKITNYNNKHSIKGRNLSINKCLKKKNYI
jgi:transposase